MPGGVLRTLALPCIVLFALSMDHVYESTFFRLPGFVSERVATRLLVLPVLTILLLGVKRIDSWTCWRRGWRSAANIAILMSAWFLIVQLALRASAWRPEWSPPRIVLPIDVLSDGYSNTAYALSVWVGAAVTLAAFGAIIAGAMRRTRGEDEKSAPA
jgi:hypothetical protein